jgi:hypothetical protein
MVVVEVGEQDSGPEGLFLQAGLEVVAQLPKPGAEVEDDGLFTGHLHQDTRGVAAVSALLLRRARAGAPDTEEGEFHGR